MGGLTVLIPVDNYRNMTGDELRHRIDQLGLYYTQAAKLLGLSLSGLHHQMRGDRPVSAQTVLLLERLEAEISPAVDTNRKRRA
jgi:hypothetical protein